MYRKLVVVACMAATLAATPVCVAQGPASRLGLGRGGLLARLNKPVVPGLPTLPGLSTFSPLGLIAPRLSTLVSVGQLGGLKSPAGRLSALGVVSPRISPIAALATMPPKTASARRLYALSILSPRVAVVVGMLKAFSGMASGLR